MYATLVKRTRSWKKVVPYHWYKLSHMWYMEIFTPCGKLLYLSEFHCGWDWFSVLCNGNKPQKQRVMSIFKTHGLIIAYCWRPFFMPPPSGAGGIMLSGCPSVRLKPEMTSFDLYMRLFCCRSVRPSVRPSIRRGFRALIGKAWREWPEILLVDVSWPPPELIRLWSRSVDFQNLALFWLSEAGQIWGFPAIAGKHEGNGLKFFILVYLNRHQKRLVYGCSFWIFFLNLALFLHNETGQI